MGEGGTLGAGRGCGIRGVGVTLAVGLGGRGGNAGSGGGAWLGRLLGLALGGRWGGSAEREEGGAG